MSIERQLNEDKRRLEILKQRIKDYQGSRFDMEWLIDIDHTEKRIELTQRVLEGEISEAELYQAMEAYTSDFKTYFEAFHKKLQSLREEQARLGIGTPASILLEIDHLKTALEETQKVMDGEISETEWYQVLLPLQVGIRPDDIQLPQNEEEISGSDNLKKLINLKVGRLQRLKEIQAVQGLNTEPHVIIEIEDLEGEVEKLQTELAALQPHPPTGDTQDVSSIIEQAIKNGATSLDLSFKQLMSVPPEVAKLSNLKKLDLSFNQLVTLPQGIAELTNLEILSLRSNQIKILPPVIAKLSKLKTIDLRTNRLTSLPTEIVELSHLKTLDLRNNLLPIPSEILEQLNKPNGIINYYQDYRDSPIEKIPLNEAKMLIIGEGEVGKTSLVNRLIANRFNPTESKTEGISIQRYHLISADQTNTENPIWLNIWDFGGQEIMHATHQFFLTKRSVYLLVLDARRGEQESRVEYWLKLIQSFGGNSPIIVACNKSDEHELDLDWTGLQKKYPTIKAFVKRLSCKTGEGIDELRGFVKREVSRLEHVSDPLLASWVAVKTQLEEMQKDYISYQEYQEICKAENIIDELNQRTLIRFLNDLGVVLHFQDHPILEDTNVLNPEWVTRGVYQILNSHELAQNKGVLERQSLDRILDPQVYPRNKHQFIIDMMRKFELCFDFEGQADKKFLIPELLRKDEPDTGNWKNSLAFEYHYDILPGSVISRFIVRMHTYISKNTYWRNGVVLISEDEMNRALIKADIEDKKIFINVTGQERTRRQLLELIRADFRKIHKSIPEIKVKQKVPLADHPGVVVDYEHLLNLEALGEETLIPEGLLEKVSVKYLLYGIGDLEEQSNKTENTAVSVAETTAPEPNQLEKERNNPWVSGSFYVFVFVIVMVTFGIMGNYVAWYILPVAFIAGLIAIPIIGVLQSLNDGTLSEKGFLTVIIESYKRLVLLRDKDSSQETSKKALEDTNV